MQVQVNTTGIDNKDSLERWAQTHLNEALERFRDDITRVEVHISDENGSKSGDADKRCTLEARLVHQQPVAVHHDAGTQDEAFRGATEKLKRVIDSAMGRAHDQRHRERASIRRDATLDDATDSAA